MTTTYPHTGTAASTGFRRRKRRRKPLLALFALVLVAAAAAAVVMATTPVTPSNGDRAQRAASFVHAQLESSTMPAASYAVIEDGHLAAAGAVGDGVTPNTPFLLGSLSKSFTALSIMQLMDRDVLELDDPVTRYIPWFRTASPGAVITVRQLLNQSSGIPTSAGTADLNSPRTTLEQRVRALARVPLAGTPGETFRYSNKNYATLGLIVERVSGQDYGAYVRRHIFAPLEMHNSYTDQRAAQRAGLAGGTAAWFGASFERGTEPYPGALPDGYLISTATDVAHFLRAQLDGTYQGTRIVSERGLELMHSASVPARIYPKRDHYGFGWATGTLHGQRVVSHAGELSSYYANAALLPESGDGLIVLTARHALLDDKAAPMHGAMELLSGGPAPEISRSFLIGYIFMDALALASLAGLAVATRRLLRRLRGLRRDISVAGVTKVVLLPGLAWIASAVLTYLAVFLGLGAAMNSGGIMPLATALDYAPDVTAMVLALVGFLAVRGIAVLIAGMFARRPAH